MKRLCIFGLVFIGCLILNLSGCFQGKKGAKEETFPRMVALLPGEVEDQSWNNSNYQGILTCRKTGHSAS